MPKSAIAAPVRPGRFRHRPTTIEAMQWTPQNRRQVLAWMLDAGALYWADATGQIIRIMTPQGARACSHGDWVVRGIVGEWYVVMNRVFVAAYEELGG